MTGLVPPRSRLMRERSVTLAAAACPRAHTRTRNTGAQRRSGSAHEVGIRLGGQCDWPGSRGAGTGGRKVCTLPAPSLLPPTRTHVHAHQPPRMGSLAGARTVCTLAAPCCLTRTRTRTHSQCLHLKSGYGQTSVEDMRFACTHAHSRRTLGRGDIRWTCMRKTVRTVPYSTRGFDSPFI